MTLTKVLTCAGLSLAVHGAVLTYSPWVGSLSHSKEIAPKDQISVSYISQAPQPEPKEAVSKPVPKRETASKLISPPKSTPLPLTTSYPDKKTKPAARAIEPAPVKKSEDLLLDPEKGKIFSSYFVSVRSKIEKAVREHYGRGISANGSVTLYFILTSDGRLHNVSVQNRTAISNESANAFAVECLESAAPFERFPKELVANKISFNITVMFQ